VNLVGRSVAPLAAMLRERGIPVVLVSGYQSPDIPAAAVLQKPVDHAALAAALREHLAPEPTSDAYPA
jgi:hypothetical protein